MKCAIWPWFYGAVNFFCNLPTCFFQEQVNETYLEIYYVYI